MAIRIKPTAMSTKIAMVPTRVDDTAESGLPQGFLGPDEHHDAGAGHGKECRMHSEDLGGQRMLLQHPLLAAVRGPVGAVVRLLQDLPRDGGR